MRTSFALVPLAIFVSFSPVHCAPVKLGRIGSILGDGVGELVGSGIADKVTSQIQGGSTNATRRDIDSNSTSNSTLNTAASTILNNTSTNISTKAHLLSGFLSPGSGGLTENFLILKRLSDDEFSSTIFNHPSSSRVKEIRDEDYEIIDRSLLSSTTVKKVLKDAAKTIGLGALTSAGTASLSNVAAGSPPPAQSSTVPSTRRSFFQPRSLSSELVTPQRGSSTPDDEAKLILARYLFGSFRGLGADFEELPATDNNSVDEDAFDGADISARSLVDGFLKFVEGALTGSASEGAANAVDSIVSSSTTAADASSTAVSSRAARKRERTIRARLVDMYV